MQLMHLRKTVSTWLNQPVELPIDPNFYYEKLQGKINHSTFEKQNVSNVTYIRNTLKNTIETS